MFRFWLCFLLSLPLALAAPARVISYSARPSKYWGPASNCSNSSLFPTSAGGSYIVRPTAFSSTSMPTAAVQSVSTSSSVSTQVNDSDDVGFAATTTFVFTSSTLPTGLVIDTDLISGGSPDLLDHKFDEKNVAVNDGFLELTVPGGQTGDVISCAEVATDFNVLYGSVRTYAVLTETAGVCNGMNTWIQSEFGLI